MAARKAFVHVGTHKTGTKSIQLYAAEHLRALREIGIYVPDAGRVVFGENVATPGHHALAQELALGERVQLDALLAEIEQVGMPNLFLSSEEFHPLASDPTVLSPLRDALAEAGYETTAIVYLRAQAEYATSLFAELAKGNFGLRFGPYVRSILETGRFGHSERYVIHFEYSHLLAALAALFGHDRIVARRYDPSRESRALIEDMLRVLATLHPPLRSATLSNPSVAINTRSTFRDVLAGMYADALVRYPAIPAIEPVAARLGIDLADARFLAPFAPLLRDEALAFAQRFAEDNARVAAMANVTLAGADLEDVAEPADPRWTLAQWQRDVLDVMTDIWLR